MHIFRALVARYLFYIGKSRLEMEEKKGVFFHPLPPYNPPPPQKLSRVTSGSFPMNFGLEATPFVRSMKNGLV